MDTRQGIFRVPNERKLGWTVAIQFGMIIVVEKTAADILIDLNAERSRTTPRAGLALRVRIVAMEGETAMGIPQGDLALLNTEMAKRLLNATIPARIAYVAKDGTPRVVPTWFHWNGSEIVMATYIAGPHVHHYPARPAALRANPNVAITIDTEGFPPQVLSIRGQASVTEVSGLVGEFEIAASRYLGEEGAKSYLSQMNKPGVKMARIAVRPTWVGVLDFETRLPSHVGGVIAWQNGSTARRG